MNKHWLREAEQYLPNIEDGTKLTKYISATAPNIKKLFYPSDAPDWRGMAGPVTIQLGEAVPINITD